jgi:hypothetical protein
MLIETTVERTFSIEEEMRRAGYRPIWNMELQQRRGAR